MVLVRRRSHYEFLESNFDTILTRMSKSDYVGRHGGFTSSGDKYHQYKDIWEKADIPFFHGAAMYHLLELFYTNEARETRNGWVHPYNWVIDNYKSGHNLSQYMQDME